MLEQQLRKEALKLSSPAKQPASARSPRSSLTSSPAPAPPATTPFCNPFASCHNFWQSQSKCRPLISLIPLSASSPSSPSSSFFSLSPSPSTLILSLCVCRALFGLLTFYLVGVARVDSRPGFVLPSFALCFFCCCRSSPVRPSPTPFRCSPSVLCFNSALMTFKLVL